MMLPFTDDQFFGILAQYNHAFLVVIVVLWLASLGTIAFVARDPVPRSRTLSIFLGGLWLWNAVAYHAFLFTRINPAAWWFAALFVVQAVLFLSPAIRNVEYFGARGWKRVAGISLIVYAFAYPFLTMLAHPYPGTPTFGVPCPTTILTIGILLTVRRQVPVALVAVPVVWSLIGGSAAVLLRVPTDFVLMAAGVLMTAAAIGRRDTRRVQRG